MSFIYLDEYYFPSLTTMYTWIREFDDLVLGHSGQLDDLGVGTVTVAGRQLEDGPEVGHETDDVLLDRQVHVNDVLNAQVTIVEGERVRAKPAKEK